MGEKIIYIVRKLRDKLGDFKGVHGERRLREFVEEKRAILSYA